MLAWYRRAGATVGLLVVAVVALTGCVQSQSLGPPPIKVGTFLSPTVQVGNWLAAVKAAAAAVNAAGGIKGRRIEVDNCDNRNDPNIAELCARKLMSDGVVATAGDFTEFGNIEAPLLDQAGIPEIGPFVFSREEASLPTSFPWQGGNTSYLAALMFGIKKRGLHTLFMGVWDAPSELVLVQQAHQFAKLAGIDIVGQTLVPEVATDYTQYVQQAIQSGADVYYGAMPPAPQIGFLSAAKSAGAKFVVAFPYGELSPDDIAKIGGPNSVTENAIEFSPFPPFSAAGQFPALQEYQRDMDIEYHSGDRDAAPNQRSGGTLGAWLSLEIIAKLATTLPTVTAATLLNALKTNPTVDTLGLTAPWHPGQAVPALFPKSTIAQGYFITQKQGTAVLESPTMFDTFQAMGFPG